MQMTLKRREDDSKLKLIWDKNGSFQASAICDNNVKDLD